MRFFLPVIKVNCEHVVRWLCGSIKLNSTINIVNTMYDISQLTRCGVAHEKVRDSTEGSLQVNIKHVRGPHKFILQKNRT